MCTRCTEYRATRVARPSLRRYTNLAMVLGRSSRTPPRRQSRIYRASSSHSTPSVRHQRASHSPRMATYSRSSRHRSSGRIHPTSRPPLPLSSATWSPRSQWIDWYAATWASARPRWRYAQPSRRHATASRPQSLCLRPSLRYSTTAHSWSVCATCP